MGMNITQEMLDDNKFIKKYKKEMTDVMLSIDPSLKKKDVEKVIMDMIEEQACNPKVVLDNNYTGESIESSLLSVLDWVLKRKPIICGNATFYKNQYEAMNPIANMLKDFLTQRKKYKAEMFKIEDTTSPRYKDFDRYQLNEKVNANS